jgi:hypothetical protein
MFFILILDLSQSLVYLQLLQNMLHTDEQNIVITYIIRFTVDLLILGLVLLLLRIP